MNQIGKQPASGLLLHSLHFLPNLPGCLSRLCCRVFGGVGRFPRVSLRLLRRIGYSLFGLIDRFLGLLASSARFFSDFTGGIRRIPCLLGRFGEITRLVYFIYGLSDISDCVFRLSCRLFETGDDQR